MQQNSLTTKKPQAALLLTGNELLEDNITDTNSLFLSQELHKLGIQVVEKITVKDQLEQIIYFINLLTTRVDIVIVNGGLGLTADDYTNRAMATATSQKLVINKMALSHLENKLGRVITKDDLFYDQALLPNKVEPFPNPVGLALGYQVKIKQAMFYTLPGVPREMKAIFKDSIQGAISELMPNALSLPVYHINTIGLGESKLQAKIYSRFPQETWQDITLGFRAALTNTEIKITPLQESALKEAKKRYLAIKDLLSELVFSNQQSLPQAVFQLLKKHKKTISFAESCTGGRLTNCLIRFEGASDIVKAGLVTYTNDTKNSILNVPNEILCQFGAVSKNTITSMLLGAYKLTKSDYVVATSGFAGPGGGTKEQPVGSVWIGIAKKGQPILAVSYLIQRERVLFQELTTHVALDLIRRHILHLPIIKANYPFATLLEGFDFINDISF